MPGKLSRSWLQTALHVLLVPAGSDFWGVEAPGSSVHSRRDSSIVCDKVGVFVFFLASVLGELHCVSALNACRLGEAWVESKKGMECASVPGQVIDSPGRGKGLAPSRAIPAGWPRSRLAEM